MDIADISGNFCTPFDSPFYFTNVRKGSLGINKEPVADLVDHNGVLVLSGPYYWILEVSAGRDYDIVNKNRAEEVVNELTGVEKCL